MTSKRFWIGMLALGLAGCSGKTTSGGDDGDDTSTDDTPSDDTPSDDTPSDDTPTDDTPSDDTPAEIDAGAPDAAEELPLFSFFVTSLETMVEQSNTASLPLADQGFGGNLGGLAGADQICQNAAAAVGFGGKTWRAFLSVTDDGSGNPVHAIDRIGDGPWYDRNGALIAENRAGLVGANRPEGDEDAVNDMANEFGVPIGTLNQNGDAMDDDNHDILTGSDGNGELADDDPRSTCDDWTYSGTSTDYDRGRVGHAWPAQSGQSWLYAHPAHGCSPGVNLIQNGPGNGTDVGAGGGWGAIYCFALTP
jgi:hypothetical protein